MIYHFEPFTPVPNLSFFDSKVFFDIFVVNLS